MRGNQRYGRQNYNSDGFRGNFRNQSYETGGNSSYNRQFRDNNIRDNRSIINSISRSGSRASTSRDRIRCLNVERMIISQETVQQHKQTQR